ncbi:4Fe-4S dicluster domain-containing protein [Chloroflexota bacterium]
MANKKSETTSSKVVKKTTAKAKSVKKQPVDIKGSAIKENGDKPKTGAVMVVGGGISGMQSALDLANSGFKVYVVEEGPSIGGRMAQLDKTFPTNDCSMCMISPKLIETGKHLNIEILTNSQVQAIDGEEGNFKIDVLRKARYIDIDKCTGCGSCAQTEDLGVDVLHLIDDQTWVDRIKIDEQKCIQCGECAVACLDENPERQGITTVVKQSQKLLEDLPAETSGKETLIHELGRMSESQRKEFWQQQFSKCIKCYGCREVCPICLCDYCELEDPEWVTQGQVPAEFPLFHIIRAYHVGTNCIGCGACGETCPMGIPLNALMTIARIDGAKVFEYVPGLDKKTKTKLIDSLKKDPVLERKVRV